MPVGENIEVKVGEKTYAGVADRQRRHAWEVGHDRAEHDRAGRDRGGRWPD